MTWRAFAEMFRCLSRLRRPRPKTKCDWCGGPFGAWPIRFREVSPRDVVASFVKADPNGDIWLCDDCADWL